MSGTVVENPMSHRAVDRADTLLSAHRQFGDSTAIELRNVARYRLGLTMLARRDEASAPALRAVAALDDERLRPLLFDPVLRNCFEDDMARLENDVLEHSALGAHFTRHPVDPASGGGTCEALTHPMRRAWDAYGPAWILTGLRPRGESEEALGKRLLELYRNAFEGREDANPIDPDAPTREGLRSGADLLVALMPHTGASVLRHVALVGFTRGESAEGPLQSLSGGDPLPSAVLMAPERCATPWLAAETLLHEGAHLKLFDALRSGSVVEDPDRRVPIPWRIDSWRVVRVFVALHFYVHMLVFQAASAAADDTLRERFGAPPTAEDVDEPSPGTPAALEGTYRTSAERARYLAGCALALPPGALTDNGRRFLGWLLDTLRLVLDDVPEGSVAPATVPDATVADVPAGSLTRVEPVDACALPELGQLVVATAHSAKLHWLNRRSWAIYALCDGRDGASLRAAYAELAKLPAGSDTVAEQVARSVEGLAAAGLITVGA
ncbi:HEXXH motif-containing putative peptide modification protein [Streptomyces sp. ASQP_92]|uniref:aKG-HExxH-type peptide beta-hydroxylase n=1 Tax=Streptomyces sp. ASQP_92 TaxID=2979116 RepID=UPI0021C144AC|nr:HEXXH motif-containing putative peptide modification protein [Streptomyces sp. ASQP_92]MCT9091085.1 HEXXH motif-containing putative peptide modification protein [Streptomyces sp. ASQP_92]